LGGTAHAQRKWRQVEKRKRNNAASCALACPPGLQSTPYHSFYTADRPCDGGDSRIDLGAFCDPQQLSRAAAKAPPLRALTGPPCAASRSTQHAPNRPSSSTPTHPPTHDAPPPPQAALANVLLFKNLEVGIQRKIVESMWERRVPAGEILIQEGDVGAAASELFVVKEGKFEVGGGVLLRFVVDGGRWRPAWAWSSGRSELYFAAGTGALLALPTKQLGPASQQASSYRCPRLPAPTDGEPHRRNPTRRSCSGARA